MKWNHFTKKYGVKTLAWFQYLDSMPAAIEREKQLKEWKRAWKLELIESSNPDWRDLYGETCEQGERPLYFRHPYVSRDPDFPHVYWLKAWSRRSPE